MRRLAAQRPRLIVLEDLQWADASTLELLHFLARQTAGDAVVVVGTENTDVPDLNPALRAVEQSLTALQVARVHTVEALDYSATAELVERIFGVDETVTRGFVALIYGWTRGNPFFLEETLKALVATGRLYRSHGRWVGWEVDQLELPRSIRDAVLARAARLSNSARSLVEYAAVMGMRVPAHVLSRIVPLTESERLRAVHELRQGFLTEKLEADQIVYHFTHPLARETIYGELGLTGARALHGKIAAAFEAARGTEDEGPPTRSPSTTLGLAPGTAKAVST
jgi:predicted ATPase